MLLSIYLNTSLGCITVLGVYLGDSPSANSLWVDVGGQTLLGLSEGPYPACVRGQKEGQDICCQDI